jgi:hypothetical protein
MKPVRCPCCRLRIDGQHVWVNRSCVACGAQFSIGRHYFWTMYALALVASAGIAFAVGNRDYSLQALVGLIVLPVFWVLLMISLRLFPVDVGVVVEGWSPGDSEEDRALAREFDSLREIDPVLSWVEESTLANAQGLDAGVAGPLPLSTPRDPPISFEGVAIAIAFAALLAYNAYLAIEPHI